MVAREQGDMEAFELIPTGRGRVWYVVQIEGQKRGTKRFLLENLKPPGCQVPVGFLIALPLCSP